MNIDKKDIEQYLSEVKEAVKNDRYRLDQNAKREDKKMGQKHPLTYYFK